MAIFDTLPKKFLKKVLNNVKSPLWFADFNDIQPYLAKVGKIVQFKKV